jgi:hypothetical protein
MAVIDEGQRYQIQARLGTYHDVAPAPQEQSSLFDVEFNGWISKFPVGYLFLPMREEFALSYEPKTLQGNADCLALGFNLVLTYAPEPPTTELDPNKFGMGFPSPYAWKGVVYYNGTVVSKILVFRPPQW